MKENLFHIGFISKLNGYKGEVVLILEHLTFKELKKEKFIFIELDGIPVPFAIESVLQKSGNAIVKLEDVDNTEYAKRLLGNSAFIETRAKKKKTEQQPEVDLIGYEVIDKLHGSIGTINKVEEYPQQLIATCLVNNKEVLIPLNESFLEEVNDEEHKIYVSLPDGLLDVYL